VGATGVWSAFKRHKAGVAGIIIVLILVLSAIFADWIAPYRPTDTTAGLPFSPPSRSNPFGTDNLGRDIFSGVVHGGRVSLMVGITAALGSTLIGTLIGVLAGYFRGTVDNVLMRITEVFQVVPTYVLALVMIALVGPGITNVMIAIALLSWPSTARLVRAETLRLRQQEFVEAALAVGTKDPVIIWRHILPNAIPAAVINGSLQVATAILIEAGLSFLGLGDPNFVSWGIMLQRSQAIMLMAPWTAIFPGAALSLAALGFNLAGDALNDALDPRLRTIRQN